MKILPPPRGARRRASRAILDRPVEYPRRRRPIGGAEVWPAGVPSICAFGSAATAGVEKALDAERRPGRHGVDTRRAQALKEILARPSTGCSCAQPGCHLPIASMPGQSLSRPPAFQRKSAPIFRWLAIDPLTTLGGKRNAKCEVGRSQDQDGRSRVGFRRARPACDDEMHDRDGEVRQRLRRLGRAQRHPDLRRTGRAAEDAGALLPAAGDHVHGLRRGELHRADHPYRPVPPDHRGRGMEDHRGRAHPATPGSEHVPGRHLLRPANPDGRRRPPRPCAERALIPGARWQKTSMCRIEGLRQRLRLRPYPATA